MIEIVVGSIVLAGAGFVLSWLWWPLGFLVVPIWIWLIAFFRDPERVIPDAPHLMVSPADGKVTDIGEIANCELFGGAPALRVGIFLSVFNVHVNRAPCDGRVINVIYKKGRFISALHHNEASEQNESNTIVLAGLDDDRPIAVIKQIVGLIARRIIFPLRVGDQIQRGARIGMIKFGSRTELYIPISFAPEVQVKIGQTVAGARDVIAILKSPGTFGTPAPRT